MSAVFKKYQGQNGVRGQISVEIQSESEANRLQDYFANRLLQKLKPEGNLDIPLKYFAEELHEGYELTIPDLYEILYRVPLVTKPEQKQLKEHAWMSTFERASLALSSLEEISFELDALEAVTYQWFERLKAGRALGYRTLKSALAHEKDANKVLQDCLLALWYLFMDKEKMLHGSGVTIGKIRIPMFAYYVMKDPHGFDWSQPAGRLLWYALDDIEQETKRSLQLPCNDNLIVPDFMRKRQVYRNFGLLDDDISSFFYLFAFNFTSSPRAPGITSLREVETKEPFPHYHTIYLFENPSVFTYLVDEIIIHMEASGYSLDQLPSSFPAILCTSGRARRAALLFIERCAKVNPECRVLCSWDMDLAGVQMMSHMQGQFPTNVAGWRMDAQTYLDKLSDKNHRPLLPKEIKQLEKIASDLTLSMAEEGIKIYQEGLGKEYKEDVLPAVDGAYHLTDTYE